MIKRLLTFICAIVLSYCSFAQTLTKLEGADLAPLSKVSKNGKWACGTLESFGSFCYDIKAGRLSVSEGLYYADDVSGNGVMVGAENEMASICKDGEWKALPMPVDKTVFESYARGISDDGKVIAGFISLENEPRMPYVWTLQSDDTYKVEALPCDKKDFTDRDPLGIDALLCSTKGDTIGGRLVDWTGSISLPVYWAKDNAGVWQYHLLGKDVVFKEGAVIPSIPDPVLPNAMEYFMPQDSITYNEAVAAYKAGEITENPAWNKEKYITNPDSIAEYNAAAQVYNDIMVIVGEKTNELYSLLTQKYIDVYSLTMSGNGNYIAGICLQINPNAGPEPLMEGDEPLERNFPIAFDLKAGKCLLKDFVLDGMIEGVTDNGDIFYGTPNMERTRTSFVIPGGTNENVELTEWVKRQTAGALDMRPDFLFSYEYDDWETGNHIVIEDTLIVGDVRPSANGRVLLGSFMNPVDGSPVVYFVDMDAPSDIKKMSADSDISVYPNPATNVLHINRQAENVKVLDLAGRLVYESSSASNTIPVDTFGKGTYLVKITSSGKVTTHKVLVTN